MSFNGIQQIAAVLGIMQDTRHVLLGGDNQDIRLGQLLDEAKDCIKDRFAEETLAPDMETVNASMKAIDEGDTEPIQEVIDSCLQWNEEDRTLEIKVPTDNMVLQIGLEGPQRPEGE